LTEGGKGGVIRTQYNAVWGTGAKIKGKTRATSSY